MKRILFFLLFTFVLGTGISQQTVGLTFNSDAVFNGYTLFSTNSDVVYLIDNCGFEVHSWTVEDRGAGPSYILQNGDLLKLSRVTQTDFVAGGGQGKLELYDWDGVKKWSADYSTSEYLAHHDIFPMDNGNILVLAWELKSDEEALSKGRETIPQNGLWSETVVEIKPVGTEFFEIVWKWDIFDHLIQDTNSSLSNYGVVSENPQLLDINKGILNASDWLHFNGIDYNEELDQIILSSRSMNEFYIIDHSTTTEEAASHQGGQSGKGGDLLFRWGNPFNYDMGGPEDQFLYGQHNARWIKEGTNNGNITAFNNGAGLALGLSYSTVVEIEPVIDNSNYQMEDGRFLPNGLAWEFKAIPPQSFYSSRISSAQRLANDNTFINEGNSGRFFEVDYEGNLVWEYISPIQSNGPVTQGSNVGNNSIFKSTKYSSTDNRFDGRDLTSGEPLELDPLDYECETSAVVDIPIPSIKYSNPINNQLHIWLENMSEYTLSIHSLAGQKLHSQQSKGNVIINVEFLIPGLYVVRINEYSFKVFKQ